MFGHQVAHKIDRTERELRNLDLKVQPKAVHEAKEQVSEEEMFTLRKIGMRMKPHLLLGKRTSSPYRKVTILVQLCS